MNGQARVRDCTEHTGALESMPCMGLVGSDGAYGQVVWDR